MHRESYFKGVITFSRAKITLQEVTQGKAMSLNVPVQRNSANISEAFGCVEICNVLSGKHFIDGETPG